MPVAWEQLRDLKSGAQWTIATAREYVSFQRDDPWVDYWKSKQSLTAAIKAGTITAAQAFATIEAEATQVHASADAALLSLDKALGGNAVVEAEMATRLANGTAVTDLTAAIKAATSQELNSEGPINC